MNEFGDFTLANDFRVLYAYPRSMSLDALPLSREFDEYVFDRGKCEVTRQN
jgi:hypothetical protein